MNIFHRVTLKTLKENRTRTLVTIVGIILSAAMFTAVTTSISSLQNYMIRSTIFNNGNWYGAGYGLSAEDGNKLSDDPRVVQSVTMELLGFAKLEKSINQDKPYLCVYGIQPDFTEMMPIHLVQGRLPQNKNEILLPVHLRSNGGIDWEPKDELTLQVGIRVADSGAVLTNDISYLYDEESTTQGGKNEIIAAEKITSTETRHYTVVGTYERPDYESYHAPGYTALTVGDNRPDRLYDVYLRTNSGRNTAEELAQMFDSLETGSWTLNYDLLRLYGYSGESSYNQVLYRLGTILILLIMFGSISLIYNAFSISISERTKQFGLLSSIGATKRQLTGSVLFEALFLSMIGLPLGILSGLAGIGITFYVIRDILSSFLGDFFGGSSYQMARLSAILGPAKNVSLKLHPSFAALAIALVISLLTVMISAYIPVRRAMKKSAIEAIRQSDDIAIKSRKIRTSRLTQKLFGFEGMIATKNYKRNRKKYRATVISLFLSIVLFISASSFCAYLSRSAGTVMNSDHYDIAYILDSPEEADPDTLLSDLSAAKGISSSTYATRMYLDCAINISDVDPALRNYWKEYAAMINRLFTETEDYDDNVFVNFLADEDFRSYLKQENLPEEDFFDTDNPRAVLCDSLRLYSGESEKYYQITAFSGNVPSELNLYLTRAQENISFEGTYRDEDGNPIRRFIDGDTGKLIDIPRDEACLKIPLSIGAKASHVPEFFSDASDTIMLFYPYSMMNHVFADVKENDNYFDISFPPISQNTSVELFFKCKEHNADIIASMTNILTKRGLRTSSLIDYAASVENERAMISVINIFSYGFIILISLIAAANVFNTISTNINLRRREFAMLRSIGMTPKAFSKMMNFECLLYGFKGLLYGLPVSLLVTWQIYRAIGRGLEMPFFVPWYSVAIAIGSVFLVVFATMLYSMKRIRKENTIDTLKNENL